MIIIINNHNNNNSITVRYSHIFRFHTIIRNPRQTLWENVDTGRVVLPPHLSVPSRLFLSSDHSHTGVCVSPHTFNRSSASSFWSTSRRCRHHNTSPFDADDLQRSSAIATTTVSAESKVFFSKVQRRVRGNQSDINMSSVCMYYLRGSCRFGNRCWNSHDLGSARSVSPYNGNSVETSDEEENINAMVRTLTTTITQRASPASSASRQRRQVPPDTAQKSNNKETEPQNKWTLTNKMSGETREGTPDSMLVETVIKLNEAENTIKTLRQQLRTKNDEENFSWVEHQMEQSIDNDLQCNICYELFIKPTVLNCSHTFCQECINSWTRRVNQCPTCRVYVKNKVYCLTLDTFLDKIIDCLPEEVKSRRESLKVERNNNRAAESNRNRRPNVRRRNNRNHVHHTIGMLWGDRDREGPEWNISLEEALFDPIRLGDVLGRNRNDRDLDEWDDNFSDSSLDSYNQYGYHFCSICDNMGHSSSNCPLSLMEDSLW